MHVHTYLHTVRGQKELGTPRFTPKMPMLHTARTCISTSSWRCIISASTVDTYRILFCISALVLQGVVRTSSF